MGDRCDTFELTIGASEVVRGIPKMCPKRCQTRSFCTPRRKVFPGFQNDLLWQRFGSTLRGLDSFVFLWNRLDSFGFQRIQSHSRHPKEVPETLPNKIILHAPPQGVPGFPESSILATFWKHFTWFGCLWVLWIRLDSVGFQRI